MVIRKATNGCKSVKQGGGGGGGRGLVSVTSTPGESFWASHGSRVPSYFVLIPRFKQQHQ